MEDNKQGKEEQRDSMPAFLARVPRPFFKRTVVEEPMNKPSVATDRPGDSVQKHANQDATQDSRQDSLPPVISVKKSPKGCAVVLLRDAAVIERCVLQRVAVVDGVCVEMKRHAKKSKTAEEGAEEEVGVFVAWGMRVERKITVTEAGLEEYFNSLVGAPLAEGLVATPPFQEGHVSFPLASEGFAMLSLDIRAVPANAKEILGSGLCLPELIEAQWAAKERLDDLWNRPPPPMARSLMTRVARSQLFPHSGQGGQEHENRAGDKLAELSELTGLLDGIPSGSAFLDLCGGPGAWSQHLLGQKGIALRGFGFTLKAGSGTAEDWQAETKDEWYDDLYEHPDWKALWGKDGTGDLLKPGNLEHSAKALAREHVLLVLADGGFSDKAIPPNLLELYFYRLLLAELLMAASVLSPGGKFVCKLYSSFSASTAALLFLATRLFESVSIVKPMSSRVTGPERYLCAVGFRDDAQTATIVSALARSHVLGGGASPLVTPLLTPAVSAEDLLKDQTFSDSMKAMISALCERQTQALNAMVDRADFLEEVAMTSAVCTDPWDEMAQERRAKEEREREQRHAERDAERHAERRGRQYGSQAPHWAVPTPNRAGTRRGKWAQN